MKTVGRNLASFPLLLVAALALPAYATNYYVNDSSLSNDQYCTAVGNDANNGQSPNTPKGTLQAVINAYILGPGDVVYVDAGTYYNLTAAISIGSGDSGISGSPVRIVGSTTGLTILDAGSGFTYDVIDITGSYIHVENLHVRNGLEGVRMTLGDGIEARACEAYSNQNMGFELQSRYGSVVNCVARDNGQRGIYAVTSPSIYSVLVVNNTIIAKNGSCGLYLWTQTGSIICENNIVWADGATTTCVYSAFGVLPTSSLFDFNVYYLTNGSAIGRPSGTPIYTLSGWRGSLGLSPISDTSSLLGNPLFVNSGNNDFHIQPGSFCVDAGSNDFAPADDMDHEFRPYGTYVDIGADEAGVPSAPTVSVSPSSPITVDPLVCSIVTPSIVSPGITAQYQYSWSDGSDVVTHGPSVSTSDSLSADFTKKHQVWTCSVRGYDGYHYGNPGTASTTVLNTLPGALTVSIPTVQSTSLNLRCDLTKSADPDGDVLYSIQWYAMHAGSSSPAAWNGAVITTDTFTQIDSVNTSPGDVWYCQVTYEDGEETPLVVTSSTCLIVSGGITSSYVLLGVSGANSVTLGQPVTLVGQILPSPVDPDRRVYFSSTKPGGAVTNLFPEDVAYNAMTGVFSRTLYPTEASEGRPDWSSVAYWNGDSIYSGATSNAVSFTVLKAEPELAVSLSASAAPLGYSGLTVTATMTAPLPASLSSLLSGRTVQLYLRKPDGSSVGPLTALADSGGVVTFTPAMFTSAGISFNAPGTWQFQANCDEDTNFKRATSAGYDQPDSARLTIKDRAGYAVLVLGKLDGGGEGHAEHAKTLDYVYRSLRSRGFDAADIYYLREGSVQPAADIFVDDTSPTQADVQYALQTWARDKMNAAPAPLYVVFVDHGSEGAFYIYSGSFDQTRIVTPLEMKGYLDTLQGSLTGGAQNEDVVVVYGACHSGTYVPALSGPGRVIITSTSETEVSHRGVLDPNLPGDVRDGEPFITELFRNAALGKPLKESFELASDRIVEYTASSSNGTSGTQTQTPLLDDNGDGQGTGGALSLDPNDPVRDGGRAHTLVLGYGVNAGGSIGWLTATQTVTLAPGAAAPQLEARTDRSPATGHYAWLEIKQPTYAGATLADPSLPGFQEVISMPRFGYEPGISDLANGYFRWSSYSTAFDAPGTYKVFYYVRDKDTGETSSFLLTTVYRQQTGNLAPPAVSLSYPADGATVSTGTFLAWDAVFDPNGDAVTYRLEVADDSGFTTGVLTHDGIESTFTQMPGLQDLHTYYWRVIAVDQYGAASTSNPVRTLLTNNANPASGGLITGSVKDSSNAWLSGVTVQAKQGGSVKGAATTNTKGAYVFLNLAAGSYDVAASKTGYKPSIKAGQYVFDGGTTNVATITMSLASAPFLWGDLSADGQMGTVDGALILQWKVGLIDRFPIDETLVKPAYPEAGDVDGLNGIGLQDATLILRRKVNLISKFPRDTNGDGYGPDAKKSGMVLQSDVTRTVSIPGSTLASPGETIDIPVTIDNASGLTSFLVTVNYNPAVLEPLDATRGGLFASAPLFEANLLTPGKVTVASAQDSAAAGSGTLTVVTFHVLDTAQGCDSALTLNGVELNDTTIPATTLSGAVALQDAGTPGDLDGNCRVDAVDIQKVINAALGLDTNTNADLNKDGAVDAVDIQTIINLVLGILAGKDAQ